MAQEKSPNGKPRRTRKPKAANDAPLVEQITELMMIHNKSDPKAGVQVVSEIDKDGKVKTVPADEKNENSFLKFDKNSSILENFIKNFWSQFKEPTHFRLLRMTFHDYKVNKQAIKDLAEGKKTDAVKEFLKRYEIRPRENKEEQNMNKQETAMAKKETQPQEPLQRKRLLNYILCIRFFIEVHSIVSASRFFHMPTYLRVVIECQSRFFPFFPAFSRNCPDYFLHTSGSSSFRSLSDLGAR